MNHRLIFVCLVLALLLVGCQPGGPEFDRAAIRSEVNQVLLTARSDLPSTPTFTPQPTFTLTPSPSPTPQIDLVVLASELEVYQAPIKSYGVKFTLAPQDQVKVVGRNESCKWLQVLKNEQDTGWIRNTAAQVEFNLTCDDLPLGTFRPKTGMVVLDKRQKQDNTAFIVENGLSTDGVVILVNQSEKPIYAFYIRGNESHTAQGIPAGTYWVFFSTGDRWLVSANIFSKDAHYQKFDESFKFINGYEWQVTLHPVIGGTANLDQVEEVDFPDLSE
ncbi:MAG: SH3 domain-containing protein [Anaerolineales bacterium]